MVEVIENSNLLEVKEGLICHQTNCIGVMGGGIALQIKNKWPSVYKKYKELCDIHRGVPEALLGEVQECQLDTNLIILNCFGQCNPGFGVMTDYEAWDEILEKIISIQSFFNIPIHFPYNIGCGLAGGDWNVMSKKIHDKFNNLNISVFIHKFEP